MQNEQESQNTPDLTDQNAYNDMPSRAIRHDPARTLVKGFKITEAELAALAINYEKEAAEPSFSAADGIGICRNEWARSVYAAIRLSEIRHFLGEEKFEAAVGPVHRRIEAKLNELHKRNQEKRQCKYCDRPRAPWDEDFGPCEACQRGE